MKNSTRRAIFLIIMSVLFCWTLVIPIMCMYEFACMDWND